MAGRARNTGKRAGQETGQLYLTLPEAAGEPPTWLIEWDKVSLHPGESKTVSMTVDPLYLSVFHPARETRRVSGDRRAFIGNAAAGGQLSGSK